MEVHYVGQVKNFSDLILLISKFTFNRSNNASILNFFPTSELSCFHLLAIATYMKFEASPLLCHTVRGSPSHIELAGAER